MSNTVKTTIVTGAASGIGRATAQRLAQAGHQLVLSDINADGLAAVAKQIKDEHGVAVVTVAGDVAQESTASAVTDAAQQHFGRIDALVNCAGIHHLGDIEEVSLEQWNQVMATNLTSMFLMNRAVIPHMRAQRAGAIVNLGSVSSFIGQEMQGKSSFVYNVSKAGVRQLTTSLATRYAEDGIRINCVCPGAVRTRMSLSEEQEAHEGMRTAILAAMATGHPQNRVSEPEEIAAAINFLVSDEASFITGVALPVDGGYLAR